jgi:hypothetical protein
LFGRLADNNLAFVGDMIYLANGGTLTVLDNGNPAVPFYVGQLDFPLLPGVEMLAAAGGKLAVDVARPAVKRVDVYEVDGAGQAVDWEAGPGSVEQGLLWNFGLVDGLLYVLQRATDETDEFNQLAVFEVNSAESEPLATLALPGFWGRGLAGEGDYLYLAETGENAALRIVDVADPASPRLAGELALEPADYSDLAVWGDHLYLASYAGEKRGLWHFDISERERPFLVDHYTDFHPMQAIAAGDGFLFGLNGFRQLVTLDLRPSAGPALVGVYDIELDWARDIAYSEGTLYVALDEGGVAVVKMDLEGGVKGNN